MCFNQYVTKLLQNYFSTFISSAYTKLYGLKDFLTSILCKVFRVIVSGLLLLFEDGRGVMERAVNVMWLWLGGDDGFIIRKMFYMDVALAAFSIQIHEEESIDHYDP